MVENDVFRALADPTRRLIFERLAGGAANAASLREGLSVSQPAVSQHLAVLREAGLVREAREGRSKRYEVDPAGVALIADWLGRYRLYWPARMDALRATLEEMDP